MSEAKDRGHDSVVSIGGNQYVHWHTYAGMIDQNNSLKAELSGVRAELKGTREVRDHYMRDCKVGNQAIFNNAKDRDAWKAKCERYEKALREIISYWGYYESDCQDCGGTKIARSALAGEP